MVFWLITAYGGCVAKGGIAVQLCGCTITLDLCAGGISDTAYVKAVNMILAMQEEFTNNDTLLPNPFLNIFDKDYHLTHA